MAGDYCVGRLLQPKTLRRKGLWLSCSDLCFVAIVSSVQKSVSFCSDLVLSTIQSRLESNLVWSFEQRRYSLRNEAEVLIGPIFTRELVTAPAGVSTLSIAAFMARRLLVLMCTAWLVLAGTQIIRSVGDMAKFGSILFLILAPLQLALMTFLAALRSASSVALGEGQKDDLAPA